MGRRPMTLAATIITMDTATSDAESIPSPTTAKLPLIRPATILATDSRPLPTILTYDAASICLSTDL